MTPFINIAAYKFVNLDNLAARKSELLPLCQSLNLRGTILLSHEGINMFLAGSRESVDQFLTFLRATTEFSDLDIKESVSDEQPFSRMLVRLKKEIISMGVQEIRPLKKTSPKISAQQLKRWLDEGRDIALLDVRNDYEVGLGTFENAIPIGIDHFRKFPSATDRLPTEYREKPVVMFCTGGIRCEKAGPLMEQKGFQEVYQLDGGILKYFEECGGDHYQGDCFVFDKRVAVDPNLNETDAEQCYGCQTILSAADQQSPLYLPPRQCPHCYQAPAETMAERLEWRSATLQSTTTPLPGCVPYDNVRPMNVSAKFDNRPLLEFLLSLHAKLDEPFWRAVCTAGRVRYKDIILAADSPVRAGWRIYHTTPETTEPPVSNDIRFLYEDDNLLAISKPAPLPMHPCGRFNRNSLQSFLRMCFPNETIRILHRLDAETTGVLLLGRRRDASAAIQRQFANGKIKKIYLARVIGHPKEDSFECNAAISEKPVSTGGVREIDSAGLSSLTKFTVEKRFADGTSLVKCMPVTGRTNQIRVHLAHLGWPIVGDSGYGSETVSETARLCLHSSKIEFRYPHDCPMKITAPDPVWVDEIAGIQRVNI